MSRGRPTGSNHDVEACENNLAALILLSTGWVNEEILTEALQTAQRDDGRSLAEILAESEKISPEVLKKLGELTSAVHGWLDIASSPAMESQEIVIESNGLNPRKDAEKEPLANKYATVVNASGSSVPSSANPVQKNVAQTDLPHGDSITGDAARYKKIRLYRRGGLAEIWVGDDLELSRRVAIKEILPARADDQDAKDLFDQEASNTASLEHPSIVPVYGKGRHPDGRPYYAMRFITGTTYLEEIERWHHHGSDQTETERTLSFRKLVSRLLDVCDAVHFAHCHGILHLDLKPENIILGDFGETFVLDWGLSRKFDQTATVPSQLSTATEAGQLSSDAKIESLGGTRQYMCPEQAQGRSDRLGRRSDVYCLGATLYHLLVGQSPRCDAKSDDELIHQARSGVFKPPRDLQPHADADLTAICLKAMSYAPGQRYATAEEFQRDIERWLAGETVVARPLSAWHPEQLLRFVQRHGYVALSIALALPILAIAFAVWLRSAAIENEKNLMRQHIEAVMDKATSDDPSIPDVLEVLLKHYKHASSTERDELTVARNLEKIAALCGKVATNEDAYKYLESAVKKYEALLKQKPNEPGLFAQTTNAKIDLGQILLDRGEFQIAINDYTALLKTLEQRTQDGEEVRYYEARVLQQLALGYKGAGDFDKSISRLEQSKKLLKDLLSAREKSHEDKGLLQRHDIQWLLADVEGTSGDIELLQGNFQGAQRDYNEAKHLRKQVLTNEPQNGDAAIRCAWAADNFLRLARRSEDKGELENSFKTWTTDAHDIRKELFEAKPNNRFYRRELAWSHLSNAEVLLQLLLSEKSSDPSVSQLAFLQLPENSDVIKRIRRELSRSYELARQLTDEDNSNAYSRSHRAFAAIDLAFLDYLENNRDDALEKLNDADRFLKNLTIDDNTSVLYKAALRCALLVELHKTTVHKKMYLAQAVAKLNTATNSENTVSNTRLLELSMLRVLPDMKDEVDKQPNR